MDPPYAVVSFVNDADEDNEVTSEIPSCWLSADKKQCWWPKSKNINNLISKRVPPEIGDPRWELHEIIFQNYYDTLEKARKKAEAFSSSDEHDILNIRRASRKKKFASLKIIPESSDEDESRNTKKIKIPHPPDFDDGNILIDNIPIIIEGSANISEGLPVGTVIAEFNPTSRSTKSDFMSSEAGSSSKPLKEKPRILASQILQKPIRAIDSISHGKASSGLSTVTSLSSPSTSNNLITSESDSDTLTEIDSIRPHQTRNSTSPITNGNYVSTPTLSRISNQDFRSEDHTPTLALTLRQVVEVNFTKLFRKMAAMGVELQTINERINKLQMRSGEVSSTSSNSAIDMIETRIPFSTKQDVLKFEADLSTDAISKSNLILCLKKVGGNGMKDCLIRILRRVFTNKVAKESSWLGQRDNFKVCDLVVMKCIKDTVSARYNHTDKEFEEVTSEWFRQAKQRYLREISKAAKASGKNSS